jgi:cerevisin
MVKKLILLALVVALSFQAVFAVPAPLAPLYTAPGVEVVADHYIVVFKDGATKEKVSCHHNDVRDMVTKERKAKRGLMANFVSGIKFTYEIKDFKAYSGRFSDEVLTAIRQSEEVAYVEKDQVVYADATQYNAPWGLARISHRKALSFGTFNKYLFDESAGEGVTVYIVDTGVNVNHTDFQGRARWGATIPDNDEDIDGNGHGTHVAGTVAGNRYGVAKKANIVAIKVLRSNGSGTMSDVLKGVELAARYHMDESDKARREGKSFKGSVANMSLGGGRSRALDAAVNGAVNVGVNFAVAAGNDNRDACDSSPAAAEKAITVGASDVDDDRAWFSNHGPCVDVFAPGKDILSAWIGSRTATNTISGTSMASPHVAGLAAYLLGLKPDCQSDFATPQSPKELRDTIIRLASRDRLSKIPSNTPNLLIFNNYRR